MDHSRAPLLDAVEDYRRKDRYGYTPPAHRQGRGVDVRVRRILGEQSFQSDVLASGGLDDRLSRNGLLVAAEQLMADAVDSADAFFSTCGSSLSVKAAMMAVAGNHDGGLLLGRDSHKSVVGGLVFGGIRPRWITPQWDTERHMAHPPSPEQVEQAWQRHPDAAGALVVSPSPYGTCADLAGIAEVCHRRGKPLIVDEAWGAHLPFHPHLPTWAMKAGADVCVVSVHKMGHGFEQGSVFHRQGDLVDGRHLAACADLLMTTSPNVLLYAAMDGWRRQMVEQGNELLSHAMELAEMLRVRIMMIPGLTVLDGELCGEQASHDLDRLQIMIDVSDLDISGYQSSDWLREHCHFDLGHCDHRRILASISVADDDFTAARLVRGLIALSQAAPDMPRPNPVALPSPEELQLESAMAPREAFLGPATMVPAERAAGRIAAEQLTPYPPGIPAVIPGERLNQAVVEYLQSGRAAGMGIPDATDPSLQLFRVSQAR